MPANDSVSKLISVISTENAFDQALDYFDPILVEHKLSENHISSLIDSKIIADIEKGLEKIEEALINFSSFGTLKFKIGDTGETFEIDIRPILYDKKEKILEGLRELKGEEKINELRELINDENSELQGEFERRIAELKNERQQWKQKAEDASRLKIRAQLEKQNEQLEKLSSNLYEKKVRFWTTLIERESAATIIGSVLLGLTCLFLFFIITIDAIYWIYKGETIGVLKDALEVLSNAFLLILGYFFGQTAAASKKQK